MKENPIHPEDPPVSALLRQARVSPALPPRFQQHVWRRIEAAEAPEKSLAWLDTFAAWILRPRFAAATVAGLLLAGGLTGTMDGQKEARHAAQLHYLASVAPHSVR